MTVAVDRKGTAPDSSRSSCRSTGSKHRRDPKGKQPKDSDTLNVPESITPRQSPRQKLIKMTEPPSQSTTTTPTVSSVVQLVEMPAQDLMHARLNDMERRITGVTGRTYPSIVSQPMKIGYGSTTRQTTVPDDSKVEAKADGDAVHRE